MQERVKVGRVVKYVPAYNYYQVQVMGEGQLHTGVLAQGGAGLAGTRENQSLTSNTTVLVYVASPAVCYIIGAITPTTGDALLMAADQNAPNTGVGFLHDAVFNYPAATDPTRDGLAHAGNQTAIDALPGEHTISNPIGPAIHVGYFMAQLSASDRAAIQLFRDGELVRVLGKEYQLHTFAEETEHRAQEGELSVTRKVAMLPWEALGAFAQDTAPAVVSEEDQASPDAPPTVPAITTAQDGQRGIFRYQEHTGYVGDIYHRFVEVPVGTEGFDLVEQDASLHQGVFHEHVGADGSYSIQSAKAISLEKWSLIPVPVQRRAQDDPSGDKQDNYKPCGVLGEGDDNPREDFEFAGRGDAAAHGMLGLELHGFAGDRMGLANLRAHKLDTSLLKEEEVHLAAEQGGLYPEYNLDPETMWMPLPRHQEMVVQKGRWERVKYYASRSAIQQLDDGSIVLEDGYGSQIVMAGGNIQITCPGDVLLQPGRNLVAMAPQDAVVKAGNSVDITASRKDVRLKAERNLEVIGGNSGAGGILIESRDLHQAPDFSQAGEGKNIQGLVLRNLKGAVAVLSKDLAISGLEGGVSLIQTRGELIVRGKTCRAEAEESVTISCGPVFAGGTAQDFTGYIFGTSEMTLGLNRQVGALVNASSLSVFGPTIIHGTAGINGGATINGVLAVTGAVASPSETMSVLSQALRTQAGQTLTLARNSDSQIMTELARIDGLARTDLKTLSDAVTYFNDTLIGTVAVASLRTDQDYHTGTTGQFVLPEARWQQLARLFGSGKPWSEPEVKSNTISTAPWPGVRAWSTDARLLRYEEKNFTAQAGHSTAGQDGKAATVPVSYKVLAQEYLGNSRS